MKITIYSALMLFSLNALSQSGFKWDIKDSVAKSKPQIYSDTKIFVAKTWKSANNVIQSDDKDAGAIILKGMFSHTEQFAMNLHEYTYQYTVSFFMKDNKYRIKIEDVSCISSYCGATKWPCIDPTENTSEKIGGMPSAKLTNMMTSLKSHLQSIIDQYKTQIANKSVAQGDW